MSRTKRKQSRQEKEVGQLGKINAWEARRKKGEAVKTGKKCRLMIMSTTLWDHLRLKSMNVSAPSILTLSMRLVSEPVSQSDSESDSCCPYTVCAEDWAVMLRAKAARVSTPCQSEVITITNSTSSDFLLFFLLSIKILLLTLAAEYLKPLL